MSRLIPLVMVILLLGVGAFGVWQYSENQRLIKENDSLKQQLDTQAEQMRDLENEKTKLQTELNMTDVKVTELQGKIRDLEANITALQTELTDKREDLRLRTGAITVPLSFFWNHKLLISITWISAIINRMNAVIWADFRVYFFVYHAEPQTFMPLREDCDHPAPWANRASQAYPSHDIPVGVFMNVGSTYAGCAVWGAVPYISISADYLYPPEVADGSRLLSHELLHAMCQISDNMIDSEMGEYRTDYIPYSWEQMIQVGAKRFQMPLLDDYEF